ncbi:1-phosphofructokinase [Thomasclavelia sp.]|uniref:1-phosphofructokinase n=1 Tax=Thomasclavelia sp. TaxID=3025757 RepID=UPI0026243399|nr:1-phosphofructokinase [Thomasclavelia sp.]
MIYTLTLNPALDYVADLPSFKLGQVNRTQDENIFYGGKGINVSVVLKELGFESTCLGFIAGFTGNELKRGVEEDLKLDTNFICVEKGMTRINVKIHSDQETELNGMGPIIEQSDILKLFENLNQLQSGDILILSGSVPKTVTQTIYCDILEKLKEKEVKIVVDATGELLINTLKYQPFLIKPNNHELAEIFNVEVKSIEDIGYYARKLQTMGAKNVLISMAKDGSLLIDETGKKHRLGVCQGTVRNSVGAGDSMVAGFVAGYLSNIDYSKILKLATACGGATAFSHGLATKEKIDELIKQL